MLESLLKGVSSDLVRRGGMRRRGRQGGEGMKSEYLAITWCRSIMEMSLSKLIEVSGMEWLRGKGRGGEGDSKWAETSGSTYIACVHMMQNYTL